MATKTTTKKTELDEIEVSEEETEVVTPKKTAPKKEERKYMPGDAIECRSITGGTLIMIGPKTHLEYQWSDYGDTAWVEYQDLQALYSRKSDFLTKPRFVIEDDEIVKQWGAMLKPIYDKITDQTIEELFALPLERFKSKLKNMPAGLQDAVKTKAIEMIKTEELYDIRKVREIDTAWGTDFVEMFMK